MDADAARDSAHRVSESLKLTAEEIQAAHAALAALDGYFKVVGQAPVRLPYTFTDKVRYAIAKDRRILKRVVDDLEEARVGKIKELDPIDADIGKASARIQSQYFDWYRGWLKSEYEVEGLIFFDVGQLLKDEANPIPGTVIEALEPLIRMPAVS